MTTLDPTEQCRRLYIAGQSGQLSADQGFIGSERKPILATAGERVTYRPLVGKATHNWRIVRFTAKRAVIKTGALRSRTMSVNPRSLTPEGK